MKYEINVFTRDLARGRDTTPVIIEQEREIGMDREQFKTLFDHMCLCYGDAGGALSNETYATIYVDGVYTRALRLRTTLSPIPEEKQIYHLETMDCRRNAAGSWREIRSGIWAD